MTLFSPRNRRRIGGYQASIREWMLKCFRASTMTNRRERAFRFLEESLELFQAMDCTKEEALELVGYVFSRPKGDPAQEVGGSYTTLAALCVTAGINGEEAAIKELERINTPEVLAKIRAKRANRVVPGDYNASDDT